MDNAKPHSTTLPIRGIEIPAFRIGYGTYHLLDKINASEALDSFGAAFEAGINLFDTSDNYGTELAIGRAVSAGILERDHVIIASKTGLGTTAQEQATWLQANRRYNTSPERIRTQVDNSLRVLGDDVGIIDIYQLHVYDPSVSHEAHAETMTELIADEKIRAWGVSNYDQTALSGLLQACDQRDLTRPATTQPFHNLLNIDTGIEFAKNEGLAILGHSPLLKGTLVDAGLERITEFLTLKKPEVTEEELGIITVIEPVIEKLTVVANLAHAQGRQLAGLSIAWTLQNSNVITLTTPTNPGYLEQALDALTWQFDSEITMAIDALREDTDALKLFQSTAHRLSRALRQY